MNHNTKITVRTVIHAPMGKVWDFWTNPEHIVHWAFALDTWEAPHAENDVRAGGKFKTVMAAKDKSMSFDFTGVYTRIKNHELIEYKMDDGRHAKIEFVERPEGVHVTETFEAEKENPEEMQRTGWQAILDNFKKYAEGSQQSANKNGNMQKITSHLWFDKEAKEAAEFYTSIFNDSTIKNATTLHNTPSGSVDLVNIDISGQGFTLLSAGPLFKFTPAVSFLVACDTKEEVDELWGKLSKGGSALMELGAYPFSERYGWVQDRYGLSWQVMFMGNHKINQKITPTLMFTGKQCGKAEEAINFYASVFRNAKVGGIFRYGKGQEPDREGTVMHAGFTLEGKDFAAMDSAREHNFTFNEAISFMVHCHTQEEIDYYWGKLSADPKAEQCGWLKDKYGVSWQIVPTIMNEMFNGKDKKKMAQVTEAFLKMKKFDIAKLKEAYEGK